MNKASGNSEVVSEAVPPRDRIDAIDALRGLALFGVAAVNVQTEFRVSLYQQFVAFSNAPGLDGAVERFVSFFLEWKAVSLFSILFGLGLAMQFERLSRGDKAYLFLVRRLLVLLGLGLLHLIFIWNGDILTSYALAGLLILPMLRMPGWVQSVVFGFIFFGYGLGLFGRVGAASAFLIVVAVYGIQAVFSALWLRHFRFGPIEWLWRSLMYNRKQPMRIIP